MSTTTASQQITDEVTSWPGVEAGPGRRGGMTFTSLQFGLFVAAVFGAAAL